LTSLDDELADVLIAGEETPQMMWLLLTFACVRSFFLNTFLFWQHGNPEVVALVECV
jgi:hypothetical protein